MRRRTGSLLTLAIVLGLSIPARGELILSFADATIAPGGTATLDVMVYDPAHAGIKLTGYNFDFRIERLAGTGDLQFVEPQDLGYRTAANQYIFGGNGYDDISNVDAGSGGGTGGLPAYGPYQRYSGAASEAGFGEVTVNGPMLLARLQLTAAPLGVGAIPGIGSTFKVYFVPNPGPYDYVDGTSGYFGNTSFGTVTVQAVPEPAAIVSVLSGLAIVLAGQGWRRRRDRRAKAPAAA